mmetsp:Transcript_33425/g.87666  ORF Transcript_33425/g.87666 Transcript_33425/m.87666 type:complete len:210 (+) Transcript_33425:99-728(+)
MAGHEHEAQPLLGSVQAAGPGVVAAEGVELRGTSGTTNCVMRVDDDVLSCEQSSLRGKMNKSRVVMLRALSTAEVAVAFKQVWAITLLVGAVVVAFGIAMLFNMPKHGAAGVYVGFILIVGVVCCAPGLVTLVGALRYKEKTCVSVSFFEKGASCSAASSGFLSGMWKWLTGGTNEHPVIQFVFEDVPKATADDFVRRVLTKVNLVKAR